MKHLLTLLCSLVLHAVFAQQQIQETAITNNGFDAVYTDRTPPTVTGRIINATPEELQGKKAKFVLVNIKDPAQTTYFSDLNSDGTFSLTLPFALPFQQIWFSLGEYLYSCLYVNEGLALTVDLQKLKQKKVYMIGDGITFEGKDGEVTRIMNEHILFDQRYNADFYKVVGDLSDKDPNFVAKLDSLFGVQRDVDEKFLAQYGDSYRFLIESETNAEYYLKKVAQLLYTKGSYESIEDILTPVYAVSNSSNSYLRNLGYYATYHLHGMREGKLDYASICRTVDSIFPFPYNDLVKLQFSDHDIAVQKAIFEAVLPSLENVWVQKLVSDEILVLAEKEKKIKQMLVNGQTSWSGSSLGKEKHKLPFDAVLFLNEAKTGEELLKTIRQNFPNKLVVLDIWATWCGPCINNMPYSKKLEEQAKKEGLPIEFVYLCTDGNSSEEKWANKIAELEQPGKHIYVGNEIIGELFTLFNRSGYPTYVAIKPNGEMDTKSIRWMQGMTLENLMALME